MRVLGLDTATLTAGLAIVVDEHLVSEVRHDMSGRSADLLVAIDRMCRAAGIDPRAFDAIAVGAGPGSFTGLRIGMATAKGIAFAAQRPLWAVSSLASLAHDATLELANQQLRSHLDGVIVAALDARRGELYAGCYRVDRTSSGATPVSLGTERVIAPTELAAWVTELAGESLVSFVGDALATYPDALSSVAENWLPIMTPSGASVAWLALAGDRVDVVTGGAPSYVRPPEAEVRYPDGVPGALPRKR